MASKTKIYIVLELVNGGELFDKIVKYFIPWLATVSLPLPHHDIPIFVPFMFLVVCCHSIWSFQLFFQAKYGKLKEDEARQYFQQLINAVDYCHSRGVYHRDLKVCKLFSIKYRRGRHIFQASYFLSFYFNKRVPLFSFFSYSLFYWIKVGNLFCHT